MAAAFDTEPALTEHFEGGYELLIGGIETLVHARRGSPQPCRSRGRPGEIIEALVIALVIVVFDEGFDLPCEIAG